MLRSIKQHYWKWKYRSGKVFSRFIATDIRRDVEVVDSSDIASGLITARIRTWNVLYNAKGIKKKPSYSDIQKVELSTLWNWDGELWGGPVPDSINKKA